MKFTWGIVTQQMSIPNRHRIIGVQIDRNFSEWFREFDAKYRHFGYNKLLLSHPSNIY